ncbi:hypothetical protein [Roseomonas sp. USHLN139]|uniref:hypothetical protein n=1 Tax=Roseomonas sp. USHLN139 TaxID=3081298 RepID=UPI003B01C168
MARLGIGSVVDHAYEIALTLHQLAESGADEGRRQAWRKSATSICERAAAALLEPLIHDPEICARLARGIALEAMEGAAVAGMGAAAGGDGAEG